MIKGSYEKHVINWFRRNQFLDIKSPNLSNEEMSSIICCLLSGIPFNNLIVEEKNDGYSVLVGKEIVKTIFEFICGNFAISENEIRKNLCPNLSILNKRYSELDKDIIEDFIGREIGVHILRPLTDIERNMIINVYSTNTSATSVNTEIKTVESDNNPINKDLAKLLSHPFIVNKSNVEPTIDLITQLLMVSKDGATSDLSCEKTMEFRNSLTSIPDVSRVFDYLDKSFVEKDPNLKKVHLPMIYICATEAMENNYSPEKFKKVIDNFFGQDIPDYKKACLSGTGKKSNVNTRIKAMFNYFEKNIKTA